MCELVHYLDETTLNFLPTAAVISRFYHSIDVISSSNTRRWLFFVFEGNENYFTCIPKIWCHDLASRWNCLRLLCNRFSPLSPFFWLFLRLRCEVIDPCFLTIVMNRRKKSALLLWNIAKHSIETSSRRCFCSIVSKRSTLLVHSFLVFKFSVNMRYTALFLHHFCRGHFIWPTTAMFVLAARTSSFNEE